MPAKTVPILGTQDDSHDLEIQNFKVAPFSATASIATEFEENHKHEYFEIIWLKNGIGTHQIDLHGHHYKGSVMFALSPGQIHKIEQETLSEGYVIKFLPSLFVYEKEFFDYVLDTCLFDSTAACPIINVPNDLKPILEDLFIRITEEFNAPDEDSENIVSSYLKILTTHINRLKRKKLSAQLALNNPHYVLFREFKIAVEKNYKKEHSVQKYAEILRTQPRTLNTVTRKFNDKSAGKVIQERILLEAQRSLFHENLSVKEICYELGFEDPSYFTRFFKKHTGIAPKYFKEQSSFST